MQGEYLWVLIYGGAVHPTPGRRADYIELWIRVFWPRDPDLQFSGGRDPGENEDPDPAILNSGSGYM